MSEGRVLIVSDDAEFTKALSSILVSRGYEVATVSNIEETKLFIQALETKWHLEAIVIDLPYVESMRLCAMLRANTLSTDIPIIKTLDSTLIDLSISVPNCTADNYVRRDELDQVAYWVESCISRARKNIQDIMANKRLLWVISTDTEISDKLRDYFTRLGYDVGCISTLDKAIEIADVVQPDLILVDTDMHPNEFKPIKSKVSQFFTNVPVIWIVLFEDHFAKIPSLNLEIDNFISKADVIKDLGLPQFLLICDDLELAASIENHFSQLNFKLEIISSGAPILSIVQTYEEKHGLYLIIMDDAITHISHFKLLQMLRSDSVGRTIAIILLEKRNLIDWGIGDFELGADDYVNKLAPLRELERRICLLWERYRRSKAN